jgi:hypothetical protein
MFTRIVARFPETPSIKARWLLDCGHQLTTEEVWDNRFAGDVPTEGTPISCPYDHPPTTIDKRRREYS